MNRQICASCFVVDFDKKELLVIYNKKLAKWLQPGGHIEREETPLQTAMREVKEETGIELKPIGNIFQNKIEPFAVENYNTCIGQMIDIQFIGIPISKLIINNEDNNAKWISLEQLRYASNIDDEIKEKFYFILNNYTNKIISFKQLDPMQYGRAKGTILLQKYLPKINPFTSVELIKNIEQWERNKDNYDEYTHIRPDFTIGDKAVRLEGSDGMLTSVPQMIEEMKKQNPNSALLITKTKNKQIPRYEDDGGFVVLFDMDKNIIIEFVGKGFDGRELTHGKTIHESYNIPWDKILYIKNKDSLIKDRDVTKYITNQENYDYGRKERINFLINRCNYDKELLEKKIPKFYTPIKDEIIKQVLDDTVIELYLKKDDLLAKNLSYFWIQGNIINKKLEPWELSTIDRIISIRNILS